MVGGGTMFVDVDSFAFSFFGDPQDVGLLASVHDGQGHDEGGDADDRVAPDLRPQLCRAAAPEQTFDRRVTELARGEEADGPRAPDAGDPVDRHRPDGVVDPTVFDEVDAEDDDDAADEADDHRPEGVDPVAPRGDG